MIERILVPLDGSKLAEAILPWVEEVARVTRAGVTLFACVTPDVEQTVLVETKTTTSTPTTRVMNWATPAAEGYLNKIADQLQRGGLAVQTRCVVGRPGPAIVEASRLHSLVAMATHGRAGLTHLVFGSVTETVIQQAPVPVMVLRVTGPTVRQPSGPLQRIVVPLDGSELAEHALPLATMIARSAGASIILTHSTDWARELGLMRFGDPLAARLVEQRAEVASNYLDHVAKRGQFHGIPLSVVLRTQAPAETILTSATEQTADLIIMTTHGRSGLGRWLLGSVARQVILHATIPVLLVRASIPVRATEPLAGALPAL